MARADQGSLMESILMSGIRPRMKTFLFITLLMITPTR